MYFQTKSRSSLEKSKCNNNVNFTKHGKSLEVADDSSYDYIYTVGVLGRTESMDVNVLLNFINIPMELDTGTTFTLVPKSQYKLTWPIV